MISHKTVERWGIHAEVMTADSVDRVAGYLRGKNVEVVSEHLNSFAPYLSDKYMLVVAWISSHEELIKKFPQHAAHKGPKWPALYVEFPAEKPFYPMRATSGYGKSRVTVSLYLLGWLAPDTSSWTPSGKRAVSPYVSYFAGKRGHFDSDYNAFLSAREKESQAVTGQNASADQRKTVERFLAAVPEGEVPFTRIRISAPAEDFTQDLLFCRNSRVYIMHSIASSWLAWSSLAILLTVVLSYVSAGISGRVVFGSWRPWARIGLSNCFTAAALVAAAWLTRRAIMPEGKGGASSPRWEAFVFGALACYPMLMLVMIFSRFDHASLVDVLLQILTYILSAAELLIASWIISNPASARGDVPQHNPGGKRVFILYDAGESFVRIMLMLAIPVVFVASVWFLLQGAPLEFILGSSLIRIGILVLASGLMTLGLFGVSWIIRRAVSAWRVRRDQRPEGETVLSPVRSPGVMILGALACIIVVHLVMSFFITKNVWASDFFLLRAACRALIAAELVIAAWVLWKGGSTPTPMEDRFSSCWPVALAGLFSLVAVGGLLTFAVYHLSRGQLAFYLIYHLDVSGLRFFLMPVVSVLGVVIIIIFLKRERIKRLFQDMTYRSALSVIFVILGVLSYFAALGQLGSALAMNLYVGDSLAALALISGTWLIKGELQEGPTKALRFGLLFSVVFTIMAFSTVAGVRAALAAAGV